ncbi:murein DD-endopeptidase MepM/ murein hydrolase activator NlpD [Constrictibacter sp. MBR-5]|jgi:murein DD-endopeptidase MepM/ murein hydrolase activator NlpD|uniref:peptidoglycan DD-metalloendopeptidase family protein n=1 Tax=Constrictibacter sp. MBR-5 TaxID=3156467 RepID=UPI0033917CFA
MIPLAFAAGCIGGFLRLRPVAVGAVGTAAVTIGFVGALAALAPLSGTNGPERAHAQNVDDVLLAAAPLPPTSAMIVDIPDRPSRPPLEPGALQPAERTVHVGRGDTLLKLLMDQGFDRNDAHEAIDALRPVYDPRRLRIGQAITLTYVPQPAVDQPGEAAQRSLVGLRLSKSYDREAVVGRVVEGGFEAFESEKQLDLQVARASGSIRNSLFEDGASEGVPARVMVDYIRLFSYDVDFQRDIHAGDRFDLLFERYQDSEGAIAHDGQVRYAALTVAGKTYRFYRFETQDGEVDYYSENGESVRKALLRTPIDGARLSSGFGMRRHPILGYSKMHRGIDFAAPTGTPIMAAGNGTVRFAGRRGGYGKYVSIRHNAEYDTAYAHMSRIAPDVTPGKRVKQGDIIGYVGTTGRSTGPHLHYEVMVNNQQINPMSIKLPSGTKLAGKDLARFRAVRRAIEERLDRMPSSTLIAQAPAD